MQPIKIEISHKTIIFTVFFLIFLWFLYQIRQLLLLVFISLLLVFTLEPLVEKFENFKIPRWLSIILIYAIMFLVVTISLAGIIPPFVDQTSDLISQLPLLMEKIGISRIDRNIINSQVSQLGSIPINLAKFVVGVLSNLASILVLAVFTFYLLEERSKIDKYLSKYFSKEQEGKIKKVIVKIEKRLGSWIRGELILMTAVGIISYLGFRILEIEYALPLAILAGLLEIIPNIGPTVASIPAVLAGLSISPFHALATLSWCFLVQQIENNFIVPKVMQKAVGINPLIILISLWIGFRLAGISGAVLAIPAVLILETISLEVLSKG